MFKRKLNNPELLIRGGNKIITPSEVIECVKSNSPIRIKNQVIIETVKNY